MKEAIAIAGAIAIAVLLFRPDLAHAAADRARKALGLPCCGSCANGGGCAGAAPDPQRIEPAPREESPVVGGDGLDGADEGSAFSAALPRGCAS